MQPVTRCSIDVLIVAIDSTVSSVRCSDDRLFVNVDLRFE